MLLTNDETAAILKIAPITLKAWRRRGQGPVAHYLNGAVRYKPEDVQAWLDINLTTNKPLPR